jgi:hypothetical protein
LPQAPKVEQLALVTSPIMWMYWIRFICHTADHDTRKVRTTTRKAYEDCQTQSTTHAR